MQYAIVTFDNSFYIFGGDCEAHRKSRASDIWNNPDMYFKITEPWGTNLRTNTIAVFNTTTKKWKKIGEMIKARFGHGISVEGSEFYVVGGLEKFGTERCAFNDSDLLMCELVEPILNNYVYYPEMMSVPEGYC